MNQLSDYFSEVLCQLGMSELRHPIFYNSSVGIRFEIGGDEEAYMDDLNEDTYIVNPEYLSKAFMRAKTLYINLPHKPNLLRIDTYLEEEDNQQEDRLELWDRLGLPCPHEQKIISYQLEEEENDIIQLQSYWDLSKFTFPYEEILQEIIKADMGGISELASNVYFVHTEDAVLFHLYDDRGADLVAGNREVLRPVFDKFNDWILDYDREAINKIFVK